MCTTVSSLTFSLYLSIRGVVKAVCIWCVHTGSGCVARLFGRCIQSLWSTTFFNDEPLQRESRLLEAYLSLKRNLHQAWYPLPRVTHLPQTSTIAYLIKKFCITEFFEAVYSCWRYLLKLLCLLSKRFLNVWACRCMHIVLIFTLLGFTEWWEPLPVMAEQKEQSAGGPELHPSTAYLWQKSEIKDRRDLWVGLVLFHSVGWVCQETLL
jgi:hypothetical protein